MQEPEVPGAPRPEQLACCCGWRDVQAPVVGCKVPGSPFEGNGDLAKKGVERCWMGSMGMSAARGDLILKRLSLRLLFPSIAVHRNCICQVNFSYR